MIRLKFSIVALLFCVFSINAQKSINEYKYVIVPAQYDFQKSEDLYQVNSLTKFLFEKEGFQTYLSNDDMPDELKTNRCLALVAKLVDKSKMLSTQMHFELVDCNNNVLFTSVEGRSKEKDYKKSYHECVRESFEGIKGLKYSYSGDASTQKAQVAVSTETEVSQEVAEVVKEESKSSAPAVAAVTASSAVTNNAPSENIEVTKEVREDILYAQSIENGFQLVDSTPKVLYIIQRTTVKDVYVIKDNSGIVYKKDGRWKADFYRDGALISKELNLKFF